MYAVDTTITKAKFLGALTLLAPQASVFFFSSRRRHTRFDCDWSSDVCSSDLCAVVGVAPHPQPLERHTPVRIGVEQPGRGEGVPDLPAIAIGDVAFDLKPVVARDRKSVV